MERSQITFFIIAILLNQFISDGAARSTYLKKYLHLNQIIMFWSAMWAPYDYTLDFPVEKGVLIGKDAEDNTIFVGRASYKSDLIPGKFIYEEKTCYVSYAGQEICVDECEVLLNDNYSWVESSDGATHENAVIGGSTENEETLFIGRVLHEGQLLPGKIHPSHRCIYVPFCGAEHAYQQYEILVKEENSDLVPIAIDSKLNS